MDFKTLQLPAYIKLTFILFNISVILTILYLGQGIIIPIVMSLLFAIILRPVVIFFNQKFKINHTISVFIVVILFVITIMSILFFITWQIADITDDWAKIKLNLSFHYHKIQIWISDSMHIPLSKQEKFIDQISTDLLKGNTELMGSTISSFTDVLLNTILLPIYTILILLYHNLFVTFLNKVILKKYASTLVEVLTQVKTLVQSYIVGLLIEMGIVGVLTTAGLMILGVQYAVFLGVITAILNLIPYIGIMLAASIAMLASSVNSTEITEILGVVVLNTIVQFIDNNILVPKVVGNKVRINELASMVGVIIGAAMWGLPGMFLSIPIIAIMKVIMDHIDALKPWGLLLGIEKE